MDMMKIDYLQVALVSSVLYTLLSGVESIQCFACVGISNFDHTNCFNPVEGRTRTEECKRDSACEKRYRRLDERQEVMERGCSSNCKGRDYVWNGDNDIYCCENENLCNKATSSRTSMYSFSSIVSVSVAIIFCAKLHLHR